MVSELTAAALGVDLQLYPWTGKWLELRDGIAGPTHRMHYLDVAPGGTDAATTSQKLDRPTLLMVHGNPTWSFYWRDLVKALSPTYRCVVPDHIGMGLSDKPSDDAYDYTLQRRVDDLSELVQHAIPAGKISLLVHDWGGMIGLAWAVQNAERIEKIVVLNTSGFAPSEEIRLPWQLKLARSPLGTLLVQGGNAFAIGATMTCTRKKMPASVKHGYVAPYRSFAERIATLRFVQDIPLSPGDKAWDLVEATDKGLQRFASTPILLQWGMKDFVFHPGFLGQFRKRWPHAEVDEYDAGHYVIEDVTEAICARVTGFLAG